MSKTIKEKKYYRVGETFSNTDKDYHGLLDVPFGIWITTHSFEVIRLILVLPMVVTEDKAQKITFIIL